MDNEYFTDETCHDVINSRKSRPSQFENANLAYVQPSRRQAICYRRAYQRPTVKIASETTYATSYMKPDADLLPPFGYKRYDRILLKDHGKIDFNTVHKNSYKETYGKPADIIFPRSCLTIAGNHDMTTTHTSSYIRPNYVVTMSYKPFKGQMRDSVPMECKTTMKESYQEYGASKRLLRSHTPYLWRTKFKTDYESVNRLSYQPIQHVPKSITQTVQYRPRIKAKLESNTTYNTSYQIPGYFMNRKR